MRKLIIALMALMMLFSVVSCSTFKSSYVNVTPNVKGVVYGQNIVGISLDPEFSTKKNTFIGSSFGTIGYTVRINNTSNSIVKIIWEESSITYDGQTSSVFIDGQKYIDATTPAAPTVIPAGTSISKEFFSSSSVHYVTGKGGGWRMRTIPSFDTIVTLCLEKDGQKNYYTFTITCDVQEESGKKK